MGTGVRGGEDMTEPKAYYIEKHAITPATPDKDPRGYLWCWEPPSPHATYVVACDPTIGIDNWARSLKMADDTKVDNAAIQVLKLGNPTDPKVPTKDVQVAEFAAPIDFVQCAAMLNI